MCWWMYKKVFLKNIYTFNNMQVKEKPSYPLITVECYIYFMVSKRRHPEQGGR
jgi:hypothetical protein